MKLHQLIQRLRYIIQISLNWQPPGTADAFQFRQAKIPEFNLKPRDQTKENIITIELTGPPRPIRVWREELDD